MGLLTVLRLRRPNPWEPPTLLDALLSSPLQHLITILYHIILFCRGHPFHPPRSRPPIRVVCLSDTHDRVVYRIPDGDLLIHAGDLTDDGSLAKIQEQVDWLAGLPHQHKVVVAGNHDGWFDRDTSIRRKADAEVVGMGEGGDAGTRGGVEWKGVRYLHDEMAILEFKGERRLNVYGRSGVPRCGDDSHA